MSEDLVARLRAVRVRTPEEVMAQREFRSGNYIAMPQVKYYAIALKQLQDACAADKNSIQPESFGLVRPLTFEETIRARVEVYNRSKNFDGSLQEFGGRLSSLNTDLYTASAVVYKRGTTKFKIVPLLEYLVTLGEDFRHPTLPINYGAFSGYEELDSTADGVTYNGNLSREAILEHPAWRACVQDKELLREYRDIVFDICRDPEEEMAFWIVKYPEEDHFRPLFVGSYSDSLGAGSFFGLDYSINFLRVTRGDANE